MRARIVLAAAGGLPDSMIAARMGICDNTVRKRRRRYCQLGLDRLTDAPRPGRSRMFAAQVMAEVKALGLRAAAMAGVPLKIQERCRQGLITSRPATGALFRVRRQA
jgi:transposase